MDRGGREMNRPKLALSTALVQDNVPAPIPGVDKLYIGSIHAAFNFEVLKELGITHVLNASGLPPTFPRNFTYLSVDLRDKSFSHILGCIPAANIFIESGLPEGNDDDSPEARFSKRESRGGVLVHCAGGRSRSAALCMAFLMSAQCLSFEEAMAACRAARPLVQVNLGFQLQLRAYATAGCDVHAAHQILLHKRLERFGERNYLAAEADAATSLSEESPSAVAPGKDDVDRRSHHPGRLLEGDGDGVEFVLSILDHPHSPKPGHRPRLRLSKPGSAAVQVIPPLRALERPIHCRTCATSGWSSSSGCGGSSVPGATAHAPGLSSPLFTYANVVRLDLAELAGGLDARAWAREAARERAKQAAEPFPGMVDTPSGLTPSGLTPGSTRGGMAFGFGVTDVAGSGGEGSGAGRSPQGGGGSRTPGLGAVDVGFGGGPPMVPTTPSGGQSEGFGSSGKGRGFGGGFEAFSSLPSPFAELNNEDEDDGCKNSSSRRGSVHSNVGAGTIGGAGKGAPSSSSTAGEEKQVSPTRLSMDQQEEAEDDHRVHDVGGGGCGGDAKEVVPLSPVPSLALGKRIFLGAKEEENGGGGGDNPPGSGRAVSGAAPTSARGSARDNGSGSARSSARRVPAPQGVSSMAIDKDAEVIVAAAARLASSSSPSSSPSSPPDGDRPLSARGGGNPAPASVLPLTTAGGRVAASGSDAGRGPTSVHQQQQHHHHPHQHHHHHPVELSGLNGLGSGNPPLSARSTGSSAWSTPRSEPGSARGMLSPGSSGEELFTPRGTSSSSSSSGAHPGQASGRMGPPPSATDNESRRTFRPQSAEKRRWLSRLQALEMSRRRSSSNAAESSGAGVMSLAVIESKESLGSGDSDEEVLDAASSSNGKGRSRHPTHLPPLSPPLTSAPSSFSSAGASSLSSSLRSVDRASKVAADDEAAQKLLHSQSSHAAPWLLKLPSRGLSSSSLRQQQQRSAALVERECVSPDERFARSGDEKKEAQDMASSPFESSASQDGMEDEEVAAVLGTGGAGAGNDGGDDDDGVGEAKRSSSSKEEFDESSDATEYERAEKVFFLEHLPWMQVSHDRLTHHLHSLEGSGNGDSGAGSEGVYGGVLCCPTCNTELGRWGWEVVRRSGGGAGGLEGASASSTSTSSTLKVSVVPRFAVLRRRVFASALPSERPGGSRDTTPREGSSSTPPETARQGLAGESSGQDAGGGGAQGDGSVLPRLSRVSVADRPRSFEAKEEN